MPLARLHCPDGGGGGPLPRGGPKWETVYVLDDAWLWKWFLRGFWERVEGEGLRGGEEALGRVEKGLGARVRNWDWVDYHDGEDGWESECSSRGRGADAEGVVREGQAWVDSDEEEEDLEDDDDDEEEEED